MILTNCSVPIVFEKLFLFNMRRSLRITMTQMKYRNVYLYEFELNSCCKST